jgi:hypothetical protein
MTKFTDQLWSDLAREHGPALTQAGRPGRRRVRRPRVIAGSTLALAGAGTALGLVLTATSAAPAFAVTQNSDGSVLVTVSQTQNIVQANAKLTSMGIQEQFYVDIASGPAAVKGPVTCTPGPGVSGPTVKVVLSKDGTEVIKPGTTGGNTGVGTWHIASCHTTDGSNTGGTGNTGS